MSQNSQMADEIRNRRDLILKHWMDYQLSALTLRRDRVKESDLREMSRRFFGLVLRSVLGGLGRLLPSLKPVKEHIAEVTRSRAEQGWPSETATFVFSLKQPLFDLAQQRAGQDSNKLAEKLWDLTVLLDKLGLYTTEAYQETRESVIMRQQQELMELSTPVVRLWDEVLALRSSERSIARGRRWSWRTCCSRSSRRAHALRSSISAAFQQSIPWSPSI